MAVSILAVQSSSGAIGRGVLGSVSLLDQLAPGGDLEWTISGSGLGGIADLRLLDTLGDGQRMDAAFHPQVAIRRGSVTLFNGDLLGWTGSRSAVTAATAINFDLAPTLRAIGMAGGLTDDCTVSVTFHSVIASLYAAQQAPALGRVLGQGDLLRNTAVFSGTVAGVLSSSDPAAASLALPSSTLAASIYAVNGVLTAGTAHAAYGDTVTYRIQLGLPLSAAHHVQLTASLAGLTGPFVFDAAATPGGPPPGHIQFGPNGTYTAAQPSASLTTGAAGSALLLNFGDLQPVAGTKPGTIELLVSAPLAPGASLAATVTETEANDAGTTATVSATTAAVSLNEPSLHIQTATVYASNDHATWTGTGGPFGFSPDFGQFGGVISSAGLATEPFSDQLSGVDAGDDVTFVVAVENLMPGAKAYNVLVRAPLPDGFVVPPDGDASITVSDGAGTPLAYSGNLFDPQGGLLLDPAAPIAGFDANSGQNILLISYTLRSTDRMDLSVPNHVSTAQIVSYATQPGWANRVPQTAAAANVATTGVSNLQPGVAIALLSTGNPNSASTLLALGGTATFRLTATLPEGLSRALDLSILLPAWLTAVSARVVAVGANITPQTQAYDGHGGMTFGDTLNAPDGQDSAADQVVIEVTVRPDSLPGGAAPHTQQIQAAVSIGPPGQVDTVTGGIAVGVADPAAPVITQAFAGTGQLANGQVATLRFTVTLPPGFSRDFRILDSLPAGLAYLPGSAHVTQAYGVASHGAGTLLAATEQMAGSLLTLDFGAVDAASSANGQVTIELQARVAAAVGTTLTNAVTADNGYAAAAAVALGLPVANTAPTLTGLPPLQAARDDTALPLFAGILVTDPDTGQQETLQVTVSNPANGILTNGGAGLYNTATGVYTVTGTAAAVTAAAAALSFLPTRHQVTPGQQVPTDFAVQVRDGAGAAAPAAVTRVAATAINTAPSIRNAAPGQAVVAGAQVALFGGLLLQDPDAGQAGTLTIRFSNPAIGTLRGTGPGHYNPLTGLFTSTGTLAALMAEAAGLVFSAGAQPGDTLLTLTVDDGAGGVAQDTSTLTVLAGVPAAVSAAGAPTPFAPTALPPQLFAGSAPASFVAAPAGSNVLAGTAGRDAFFVDAAAAGLQSDVLTGFGGGDALVLWGFRAGISTFAWLDNGGPPGYAGRTLRADVSGAGAAATSLTFAGRTAFDTDRFVISLGRWGGLDFLSVVSPS